MEATRRTKSSTSSVKMGNSHKHSNKKWKMELYIHTFSFGYNKVGHAVYLRLYNVLYLTIRWMTILI